MLDTFAYLQTPHGKGGIAVVVIKGPDAGLVVSQIFQPLASHADGGPCILQLGHILDGETVVDEAIVHAGPDSAEINVHGGPIAAQAVMDLLETIGVQARCTPAAATTFNPAHPELNNPAVGIEMLNCLPQARSSTAMLALTQQWSGGISKLARQVLAAIDRGRGAASSFVDGLGQAADSYTVMQRLLQPPSVVLAGAPNAGKSTLANTLVGRPVSIVHQTAGTTRDWVSELTLIQGVPIILTDTAGIWDPRTEQGAQPPRHADTEKQVEGVDLAQAVNIEAVARARQQMGKADIVLLLVNEDAGVPAHWPGDGVIPSDAKVIRLWAKADLSGPRGDFDVAVSAANGEGLDLLGQRILQAMGLSDFDPCAPRAFTVRQADLFRASSQAIENGQLELARKKLIQILDGC